MVRPTDSVSAVVSWSPGGRPMPLVAAVLGPSGVSSFVAWRNMSLAASSGARSTPAGLGRRPRSGRDRRGHVLSGDRPSQQLRPGRTGITPPACGGPG